MLQKILTYLFGILYLAITLYLLVIMSWLVLPLLLVIGGSFAWKYYQAKRLWKEFLKQQQPPSNKKHIHIASDDSVIDAEYEEIHTK